MHWSPSSMTALAEAELEYPEGHVSQSVYVAFPVASVDECDASEEQKTLLANSSLAVWTTTPWTMPANAAVAVNDQLDYAVVKVAKLADGDGSESPSESDPGSDASAFVGKTLVVAQGLVPEAARKWNVELETLCVLKGSALEGITYAHPMYDRVSPVVVGGDYITTETGTGLVHTAPGHGQEDYMTGLKFGLPLLSPVDDRGDFTDEAGEALTGLNVLGDGNAKCIELLRANDGLILQESYGHKYPYDWRTTTHDFRRRANGSPPSRGSATTLWRRWTASSSSPPPALSACARWSPAETTGASRANGRGACRFRAFTTPRAARR